mmetsp:Transcript_50634/g.103045  ORF Transcript_50634/g.103045 Transcript_50634/m.103045 type:complete len:235 (+) Transcript_50634:1067-1771(+)
MLVGSTAFEVCKPAAVAAEKNAKTMEVSLRPLGQCTRMLKACRNRMLSFYGSGIAGHVVGVIAWPRAFANEDEVLEAAGGIGGLVDTGVMLDEGYGSSWAELARYLATAQANHEKTRAPGRTGNGKQRKPPHRFPEMQHAIAKLSVPAAAHKQPMSGFMVQDWVYPWEGEHDAVRVFAAAHHLRQFWGDLGFSRVLAAPPRSWGVVQTLDESECNEAEKALKERIVAALAHTCE